MILKIMALEGIDVIQGLSNKPYRLPRPKKIHILVRYYLGWSKRGADKAARHRHLGCCAPLEEAALTFTANNAAYRLHSVGTAISASDQILGK